MIENNSTIQKIISKLKKVPAWGWSLFLVFMMMVFLVALSTTPVSTSTSPFEENPMWATVSFIMKFGVVILLIYMSLFLAQKWRGNIGKYSANKIKLIESFRLSPKQALHLIKIGNKGLLIGATENTLSHISDIDLDELDFDAPLLADEDQATFDDTLKNALSKKYGNEKN